MAAKRSLNTQKVAVVGTVILDTDHNDDADDVRTAAQAGYDGSTEWPTAALIGHRVINVLTKRLYHCVTAGAPPTGCVEYSFQEAATTPPASGLLVGQRWLSLVGWFTNIWDGSAWKAPALCRNYRLLNASPGNQAASDSVIECDSSSGSITLNLLAANDTQLSIVGHVITVLRSGANTVTVDSTSAIMDGSVDVSPLDLTADGQARTFVSDGTAWKIIGGHG